MQVEKGHRGEESVLVPFVPLPVLPPLAYMAQESEAAAGAVLDAPVVLDDADTGTANAETHQAVRDDGASLV